MVSTALPPFLYGSYTQYEVNVHTLVRWVVRTAAKIGYVHVGEVTEPSKPMSSSGPKEYKLHADKLSFLVRTVVNRGYEVPPAILSTAKRIVAARKRCATWALTGEEGVGSHPDSTSHFISELENMCILLEREATIWHNNPEDNGIQHVIANRGRNPASTPRHHGRTKKTTPGTGKKRKVYQIEEHDSMDDSGFSPSLFKLFCLFEDLHKLRRFIMQSVQEYLADKIDLVSHAVVADMALHLANELIEDVSETAWPGQTTPDIQRCVYRMICSCRGQDQVITPEKVASDTAKWCYIPTNSLLSAFWRHKAIQECPLAVDSALLQMYNLSTDRQSMSASAQHEEDEVILFAVLAEYSFYENCDNIMAVHDEISKAIFTFFGNPLAVFSASFACQIVLDMHHALRYSNQKAYNDFQVYGLRLDKTIEEY